MIAEYHQAKKMLHLLNKTGLKIIRNCDSKMDACVKNLRVCQHYNDLENICKNFNKALKRGIIQLKT